jgi:ribosomal protein L37E
VPIPFFGSRNKRRRPAANPPRLAIPPDQMEFEEQSLRLQYHAISSHGVRMPGTQAPTLLPHLLEGFATQVELIEPLDVEFQDAAPQIMRPQVALAWINAHHGRSGTGRHALYILESLDSIDLAYETFAVALLYGDLDAEGFPRFDAIVGGPISFWDETSGDLIVRIALCWGGEGTRGDTQRVAQRLLARLMANMLASQGATELGRVERPVAVAGGQHLSCPHCGFQQLDRRAHYCPKCGLRMAGN